jgi:hypothetical protein
MTFLGSIIFVHSEPSPIRFTIGLINFIDLIESNNTFGNESSRPFDDNGELGLRGYFCSITV